MANLGDKENGQSCIEFLYILSSDTVKCHKTPRDKLDVLTNVMSSVLTVCVHAFA